MARKISSSEEMFDLLASMDAGNYATICHIGYVELKKPTKTIINPMTRRKNTVIDYETLGNNLNVSDLIGILSITRYRQLNWTPQNKIGEKYGAFKNQANSVRREFGVPEMGTKKKVYQTMRYGNGISVGNTQNTQGKGYTHQNTFNANKDVNYYGINSQGNIIREFSLDEIAEYIKDLRPINGLNQLKKLTQDENIINQYIKRILDLKMEYTTFLDNRIIYMIGGAEGEKFYFVNDKLTEIVENIPIRPMEFMKIVKEKYKTDNAIMQECIFKNKNIIKENKMVQKLRITENDLHNIIREAVNRMIMQEVNVNGESLHGKNQKDWEKVGDLRKQQQDKYSESRFKKKISGDSEGAAEDDKKYKHALKAKMQDRKRAFDKRWKS